MRAFDYPAGYRGNWHRHRLGQVVYPLRGVVTVDTEEHHVTLAPYRAYALRPWRPHRVSAVGNTALRSVFFDARSRLTRMSFGIVQIDDLLHELIRRAARELNPSASETAAEKIIDLLVALLNEAPRARGYIELPRLRHPRLARTFESVWQSDSLGSLRLGELAARSHLSERQFRRLLRADTGMRFADWRSLLRVKLAAEAIARGESVTRVADLVGMSSASALGETFKRYTAMTPSAFARLNR